MYPALLWPQDDKDKDKDGGRIMQGRRLLLGIAGCLLTAAIILSLASLLFLADRSAAFGELQRTLVQILGGG